MATLGQKLEEARNRKGISIREAHEGTRIRGEYLAAFEQDNFDLDLPPVYLKGFVKVYARFLGLDPEAILAELDVKQPASAQASRKAAIGTLSSEAADEEEGAGSAITGSSPTPRVVEGRPPPSPIAPPTESGSPSILKPALFLISGIFVVAAIIVGVVWAMQDDPSPQPTPDANRSIRETPGHGPSVTPPNDSRAFTLTLLAFGPIDRLIILDEGSTPKKPPYEFKNLKLGDERVLQITDSFKCYSSSLENLKFIVNDGKENLPQGTGSGNFSWKLPD